LKSIRFTLFFSFFLTISGCAAFKQSSQTTEEKTATTESSADQKEIEYGNFSAEQDTLYDLLVAELASQRKQFDITLVNYIHQAQVTRDPAVIIRAINAAQIANDSEAIKELALLWLENEPDNIGAHQILAYQYSVEKAFPEAMEQITKILELGGTTSVEALAISSSQATENEKQQLLELYTELVEKFPKRWEVRYSLALVQRNLSQCDAAIENLEQVIEIQPSFQQAAIVKANCLNESGKKERALSYSEESFDKFPRNNAIGRLYGSLLIEQDRTEDAEQVFAELVTYYPDSPSLKLSLALLKLENQKTEESQEIFTELTRVQSHQADAYYYLGRIAEQQEKTDLAIDYYQQVSPGTHYNAAIERTIYLLATSDQLDKALEKLAILRQEQPNNAAKLWLIEYSLMKELDEQEQASDTLTAAIEAFPDNEQLLYARAMEFDQKGNLEAMEADLRKIIAQNPQNAVALNALGYTLADKTDRLQEALQLITAALSLRPDNPAIQDSMGWTLFKLGEKEKALQLLGAAYLNYPDGEVAAHLGEVLWSLGKEDDAKQVWRNSLRQQPDHPILIKTLQRLAPELLDNAEPSVEQSGQPELEPEPSETPDQQVDPVDTES